MDFVCLGFIDIFSESKEGLDVHSSMILRFLHRNRLSSTVIPYPMLDHCNNMSTMRASVLKDSLDQLVQKEKGTCAGVGVFLRRRDHRFFQVWYLLIVRVNASPCFYFWKCNSDQFVAQEWRPALPFPSPSPSPPPPPLHNPKSLLRCDFSKAFSHYSYLTNAPTPDTPHLLVTIPFAGLIV